MRASVAPGVPATESRRAPVASESIERTPAAPLWDHLGPLLEARLHAEPAAHRDSVLSETVRFLGLAELRAEAFRVASRQALSQVEHAWSVREEGWVAICSNPGLDDATRERMEREIQGRYEDAKRGAMARVEALLGDDDPSLELRSRIEEWFDALR